MQQQAFEVQGMTCGHCEKAVTQAIHRLDPAAVVRIDRSANRVEVDSETQQAFGQAIAEEGYQVSPLPTVG